MTGKLITFEVMCVVIAAIWTAVMITYHVTSGGRWRKSPAGRHLMATAGCFAWSFALTAFNIVAGTYSARFVIQVVSYSAFALIGIWRLLLMATQRRREASARRSEAPAPAPPRRVL